MNKKVLFFVTSAYTYPEHSLRFIGLNHDAL